MHYIPTGKVFLTVLALYMAEQSLPLPTFEEVLVCTPSTTFEEVCSLIEHTEVKCEFKSHGKLFLTTQMC